MDFVVVELMSPTLEQKRSFLIQLGEMLHRFGTPAYRLEAHLQNVASHLGMQGHFLVSPTTLTFCIWPEGATQEQVYNYSLRVKPGDLDLSSLARTDALVETLASGQCTLQQAESGLLDIQNSPPPYTVWVTLLAFVILPGAFSVLMQASWHDVAWSCALGALVYALVAWAEKSPRIANMLEPLAATVAAFLSIGISKFDPSINQPLVVLSSIVVFVPGLSLALGLRDLAARELISGTARIMDALMGLFKLYFGSVLGAAVGVLVFGEVVAIDSVQVPSWTVWPAVFLVSSSLAVVFKVRLIDSPWGVASGFLAYTISTFVTPEWGLTLGAFLGALAVGVYANLFARLAKAPAVLVTLQGIVILVPGSKVYVGLNSVVSGQQILPIDHIGVQSFMLFMSLVAGLVLSSAIVEPRKSL